MTSNDVKFAQNPEYVQMEENARLLVKYMSKRFGFAVYDTAVILKLCEPWQGEADTVLKLHADIAKNHEHILLGDDEEGFTFFLSEPVIKRTGDQPLMIYLWYFFSYFEDGQCKFQGDFTARLTQEGLVLMGSGDNFEQFNLEATTGDRAYDLTAPIDEEEYAECKEAFFNWVMLKKLSET